MLGCVYAIFCLLILARSPNIACPLNFKVNIFPPFLCRTKNLMQAVAHSLFSAILITFFHAKMPPMQSHAISHYYSHTRKPTMSITRKIYHITTNIPYPWRVLDTSPAWCLPCQGKENGLLEWWDNSQTQ